MRCNPPATHNYQVIYTSANFFALQQGTEDKTYGIVMQPHHHTIFLPTRIDYRTRKHRSHPMGIHRAPNSTPLLLLSMAVQHLHGLNNLQLQGVGARESGQQGNEEK